MTYEFYKGATLSVLFSTPIPAEGARQIITGFNPTVKVGGYICDILAIDEYSFRATLASSKTLKLEVGNADIVLYLEKLGKVSVGKVTGLIVIEPATDTANIDDTSDVVLTVTELDLQFDMTLNNILTYQDLTPEEIAELMSGVNATADALFAEMEVSILNCNTATQGANEATNLANEATVLATDAATLATQTAALANEKAGEANEAASRAESSADDADEAARLANSAADLAIEKAGDANNAAALANTKAGLANDAAILANAKAIYANDQGDYAKAQGEAANTAATNANAKAEIANTASQTANNAANLANEVATHPPIITGSTWRYWNTSADAYADTGIAATPYENYLQNTTDDPVLTETEWSVWSKEQGDFAEEQGDYAKAQGELAQTARENIEGDLALKIDKTSIISELGDSEELVMSQKVVSDEITQLDSEVNLKASKTFLIEESINRFDKSTVINSTIIVPATGLLQTAAGYFTSAWIPLTGDEMYYLSGRTGQAYVRFKKADETIIKPVDATTGAELPNYTLQYIVGKVKAPTLAVAFQFTSYDAGLNTAQFEKGEVATTYNEYGVGLLKDGFVSGKQNKSAPTLPTTSKTIEGAIAEIHNNKKTAINDSDTEYPTSKAVLTADNLRILKADSVNNLTTTTEGKVADARTVKTLNDNKAERTELPPFGAFLYYLDADTETLISGSDFSPALMARPASISVFSGGEEVAVSKRYIQNGDYYDVYLTSETEITDIEVSVVGAKTAQPLTFDNGKVIFNFDDSAISMYNEGLPAFQAKGATATLYTNGILADGTNPNYCRWPELLAMHNAGLDIQCHTYNHYKLPTKTEAEIHADLQQQNAAFVAVGLPAPQHLAYPEGLYNDVVKSAVSAYRKTARCSAPNRDFIHRVSDKYALTSYWIENTTPEKVAIAKSYMDEVQAEKGVLMLSGHGVTATGEQDTITTAYLLELIDYANTIGIDIINVSQLYKLMMLNYVHPRTELTLTATGTGVVVATLTIVVSEDTIVKVGGGAKMYTDAAGTLNESEERQLYAGQSTIYIRQTTGVGYISLEHDRITQIRGWASAVNAPYLGGDISLFGNLNYINIGVQNTIEGSITDMVKLSYILALGMNTLSGDISNLNSLVNLRIEGANTVTGNVENLTNLKTFSMSGNYSIYGDLSGLTKLYDITIFSSPKLLTISNVTNIKGLCSLRVFGIELTSTNVNQLLSDFWLNKDEAKPLASRQILINGNAYSGAPTGQGLIDKAALQAYRSPNNDAQYALWTVTTR